jgi:hypothetical protein
VSLILNISRPTTSFFRSFISFYSMSNSLTPTTVNIPSKCHTPPPIPSRRIQRDSILPRSTSPHHHDTTKRPRRGNSDNMTVEHPSSASDTSSQSGMADNETEAEHQSEVSPLTAPAPKKKRTRTLTTPHQSAVLHALLSQVYFCTHDHPYQSV